MEFKGTKGEWSIQEIRTLGENEGFNCDIRVVKPEGEPHYPHTNIDVWGHFATKEETEANARLISAAPELLEACMEIAKFSEDPKLLKAINKALGHEA